MTNKPPATEGLAAGLAEFVLVPRRPTTRGRYGEISDYEAALIREAIVRPLYGPQPCRQKTAICLPDGDCRACSASMGVECRGYGK